MVGLILLLIVVHYWKRSVPPDEVAVPTAEPAVAESRAMEDLAPPGSPAADVVPVPGSEGSLEGLLAEYWGSDWDRVRPKLLDAGHDLTQTFELEPWESVEPEMRALLLLDEDTREAILAKYQRWPGELDSEWMRSELEIPYRDVMDRLSDQDLQEMQAIALPFNVELEHASTAYVEGLDRALMAAWRAGRFVRAPLTTQGAPTPHATTGFYATAKASGGWAVSLCLDEESHPDLAELRNRLASTRAERNDALREYAWSRIRR